MKDKFINILNLIKEERIKQNKSQKDIANALNTTQSSYTLIENGKQKLLAIDFIKIVDFLCLDIKKVVNLESNSHISEKNENNFRL